MLFGMSTACFFPRVFTEDAIDIMADMRVKNIEVFFNCMSEYKKPYIAELKKRARDSGINIHSIHAFSIQFEPQLFTAHERARQEAEDIYKQVLEAANTLGAKVYVFHGPPNLKRARNITLNFDHIAPIAGRLADTAKEFGVKLAWENVHWCWYAAPQFAAQMLSHPGTDNLYFTLDLKQAAQSGYDPLEYIKNTAGRLVNIHVCDYAQSEERGIYPVLPFKGELDFKALRDALNETDYNESMILEVYSSNYSNYGELEDSFNDVKTFFT